MTIRELQRMAFDTAKRNGFHYHGRGQCDPNRVPLWIALCHSELSEALEDWRHFGAPGFAHIRLNESRERAGDKKHEGFPSELADVVIRVADMAEALGIDLETEIARKMEYNRTRKFRHGKRA